MLTRDRRTVMPVRIDLMDIGVLRDVRPLSVVVDILPHERSDALAYFFHTGVEGETVHTRRVTVIGIRLAYHLSGTWEHLEKSCRPDDPKRCYSKV